MSYSKQELDNILCLKYLVDYIENYIFVAKDMAYDNMDEVEQALKWAIKKLEECKDKL